MSDQFIALPPAAVAVVNPDDSLFTPTWRRFFRDFLLQTPRRFVSTEAQKDGVTYNANPWDLVIATGPCTVKLPTIKVDGDEIIVKNATAFVHAVSISPASTDKVDGSAFTQLTSAREAMHLVADEKRKEWVVL